MGKRTIFFILILFVFIYAYGEKIVIVTEEYPPFNYSENGKVLGQSTEVVEAVLKELKIKAEINVIPWARAYYMAEKGQGFDGKPAYVLIYSMGRLPEREKLFKWIDVVAKDDLYFYALKDRKDIKITNLEDAKKYKVGAFIEDLTEVYLLSHGFTKGVNLFSVTGQIVNARKLLAGKIDLAIDSGMMLPYMLKKEKMDSSKIIKLFKIEGAMGEGTYMAFSKNTPDSLVNDFKRALEKLKKNGTYNKIVNKYSEK